MVYSMVFQLLFHWFCLDISKNVQVRNFGFDDILRPVYIFNSTWDRVHGAGLR